MTNRNSNGLFQPSGYVNIRWILQHGMPFNFVVGGRAIGKTYTSFEVCVEDKIKFMYQRRTKTQHDIISKPEFNPFKSLNRDKGYDIGIETLTAHTGGIYHMTEKDGHKVPEGAPIGYTSALSTFANVRGFDASDVDLYLYDEFIPEKHERPIKHEADAFFNCYETMNRNRELQGRKPLQALCLANANNLANPIFVSLKIVRKAEKMLRDGKQYSIDPRRGIGLFIIQDSPISDAKRDTALYKLTAGSTFASMALDNDFNAIASRTRSAPLKEYRPLCVLGELCFYEHKSRESYYCTEHISGTPEVFELSDADIKRFNKAYSWLIHQYLLNNIEFEDYSCEMLFARYIKGGV